MRVGCEGLEHWPLQSFTAHVRLKGWMSTDSWSHGTWLSLAWAVHGLGRAGPSGLTQLQLSDVIVQVFIIPIFEL